MEMLARAFLAIHTARIHTCNAAADGRLVTHSLSCRTMAQAMVLFAKVEMNGERKRAKGTKSRKQGEPA